MRSIRRRLSLWFLLGLGLFWLAGGTGIYFSYRAGLLAGIEVELHSLVRQVRMNQMGGPGGGMGRGGPQYRAMSEAANFGADIFWQTWPDEAGETSQSENLSFELPRLDPKHGETLLRNESLQDGMRLMIAGGRFGMGARGVEVSVAKNLAEVHRKLKGVLLSIALSGLAVAAVAILWVFFVVRAGLAPLRNIAYQVDAIDLESLDERFDAEEIPSELQPIVSRLNHLMTRLHTSFTRERRFSSDLAHEMRTPIAELRILAESAVKWPEESGEEAWAAVLASVDSMEMVVQSMLQLARIERTSQDRPNESIALSPLIRDLWAAHASRASARGLSLRLDTEPDATVSGDLALWRHLLGNLLSNAASYADEGSEVQITTEPATMGKGRALCVANVASRLAPEDINHLFDRFWQGDAARTESIHCGLGLSLARACGEAMGMKVQAQLRASDAWLEIRIEPGNDAKD